MSTEVLLDVLILVLPIREVMRLHFSMKNKALVSLIFLLGGLYETPCSEVWLSGQC